MRILIAARHSPVGTRQIGGVQSWSETVHDVLIAQGHDVTYWEPGNKLSGVFDLGIAANYYHTSPVLKFCKRHIVICHGIIAPEAPPAKHVAFTSEGVRENWVGNGPIIRQPIDLTFWSPAKVERTYLTRFSYRQGLLFVPSIARAMHLDFRHVWQDRRVAVRNILRRSVCVLATGRAALEAMACGVPVVICDERITYQKALMERDVMKAMLNNYSGRGGSTPTQQSVMRAIDEEIAHGSRREHVKRFHNGDLIVNELMEFANGVSADAHG